MAAIKPAPLEKTHYFVKVEFFPCGKIEPPRNRTKRRTAIRLSGQSLNTGN